MKNKNIIFKEQQGFLVFWKNILINQRERICLGELNHENKKKNYLRFQILHKNVQFEGDTAMK